MNYSTIWKFSFSILLLFLVCISFENCTDSPTPPSGTNLSFDIDKLPELPIESLSKSGKLTPHPIEPILTISPKEEFRNKKTDIHPPGNIALHCRVSSYVVRLYNTQVTYPKVICYPNNAPTDQVIKRFIKKERDDRRNEVPVHETKISGIKYYKLTTLQSQKIINPLFCSVNGGPWAAEIRESGSCSSCGPGITRFELTIGSFPEILVSWTGQLQDFPSTLIPNLHVFLNDVYLKGESQQCCSSFKKCNGRCIDWQLDCEGSIDGI